MSESQVSRYIDVTEAAKMLRVALKKAFPTVKFSVKSSRYAGGASIRIEWIDGPTREEVKKISGPFAGAHFDGMQDLQTYVSSYILPDGTVAYGNAAELIALYGGKVEKVHFGSNYVFEEREYSDEFLSARVDEFKATYADGKYVYFVPSSKQTWGTAGPSIEVKPWLPDVRTAVGRYVEAYSGLPKKHYSTRVFDLRESKLGWEAVYDLPDREAVRNAYALYEMGDGETWKYDQYDHLVGETEFTVYCGNFVTWKGGAKPSYEVIHQWLVKQGHPDAVDNEAVR